MYRQIKTVCKLSKALYGLKKAPRTWNLKKDELLEVLWLEVSPGPLIYVRKAKGHEINNNRTVC